MENLKFDLASFGENDLSLVMPEIAGLTADIRKSLEEYFVSVRILSSNRLNLEFNNRDEYHAAIVMAQIFKTAKESICIFAGDLKGNICGKDIYKKALKEAVLNNDVELAVVLEQHPDPGSPGLALLKEIYSVKPDKLKVGVLKGTFLNSGKDTAPQTYNHFTVADDSIYRFEVDTTQFKAHCNFDDKNTVKILQNNFDVLSYNANAIAL